jgi:uncharacterized protein
MAFEWDDGKNRTNAAKHGIWFEDAVRIYGGWTLDEPDERFDYGEARTKSLGVIEETVILAVLSTDRHGRRRIISARQASRQERKRYEQARQRSEPGQ